MRRSCSLEISSNTLVTYLRKIGKKTPMLVRFTMIDAVSADQVRAAKRAGRNKHSRKNQLSRRLVICDASKQVTHGVRMNHAASMRRMSSRAFAVIRAGLHLQSCASWLPDDCVQVEPRHANRREKERHTQ